jgi:hypothetical protein
MTHTLAAMAGGAMLTVVCLWIGYLWWISRGRMGP